MIDLALTVEIALDLGGGGLPDHVFGIDFGRAQEHGALLLAGLFLSGLDGEAVALRVIGQGEGGAGPIQYGDLRLLNGAGLTLPDHGLGAVDPLGQVALRHLLDSLDLAVLIQLGTVDQHPAVRSGPDGHCSCLPQQHLYTVQLPQGLAVLTGVGQGKSGDAAAA